jgi:hypothetical protein
LAKAKARPKGQKWAMPSVVGSECGLEPALERQWGVRWEVRLVCRKEGALGVARAVKWGQELEPAWVEGTEARWAVDLAVTMV